MPASHSSVKRAVSEQTQLWTNADKIDDGGVYFIRNANNSNFVWDMPNNNYSDGTAPILYSSTGWGNQRFIVHEQTKYGGKMYYTITPLYSPKSTLKLGSNNENDTLKLGKDNNTSLQGFLSNKFIIEKSNYGYTISTGVSTFGKYIIPSQDNVTFNNTLVQKTISDASDNSIYQWLFCKTDTLGNDLKNKIYLNGTNTQYFNLTPPATGQFVIETERYGSTYLDTYLELYDRSNKRLASNDDIHFLSNNRYSRIIYDFTDLSDVIVRVRGKTAQDQGYVYLTLRPFHSLYFAGVYDFDKNNNDRPGSLENVKLKNYYIEVQGNRGTNAILETAANGKQKINSEYFVFSGHGLGDYAGVEFYNSTARDDLFYNQIPSLNGTRGRIIEALTRLLNNFPEVKDSAFGISGQIVKDKNFLTETFENYNRIQELFKCYLLATQLLGYAYAMIEEKASYKKVFIPNEQLVHHPALKNLANFEIALNGNFDQMWYKNPENFLDGIRVKVDMIASKNAVEIEYTGQQLINAIHITKEKEPVIAVKRNGQEEDHGEE